MLLTLEAVAFSGAHLGDDRHTFGGAGGTIGRRDDCDWVLPDSRVSSHHARISCRNGVFYVEDTSSNGIYLNSPSQRLPRGQPCELQHGDCIYIVPYEIRVTVTDDRVSPTQERAGRRDGVPAGAAGGASGSEVDPFAPQPPVLEPVADEELDPLKLIGAAPRPARPQSGLDDLAGASPMNLHYEPPPVAAPRATSREPVAIPADYDPLGPDSSSGGARWVPASQPQIPAPPPSPANAGPATPVPLPETMHGPGASAQTPPPVPRPDAAGTDLAAVLEGAGLGHVPVTPELARNFGEILRVVVGGVMDVLRARQHIKDEFRMEVTHFRQMDNNPLKFSANVDDALHNLLVKRNPAYLGPVEAFDEAFEDLRDHQMAMLAGIRVAFAAALADFDPDRLQQQFDRQMKAGALLNLPAKLRYWELYRERCQHLLRDPEQAFRRLFGEQFAMAYEEQLSMLEAARRAGKRASPPPDV